MSATPSVPDRDTVLATVYCLVDDLYRAHLAPRRPPGGRPPAVNDSEVLTLMILSQWRPDRSQRAFLRMLERERAWRTAFPHRLSQSAFCRRAHHLWGALAALAPLILTAAETQLGVPVPLYGVIDGVPVPVVRRERLAHTPLRPWLGLGRGGTDKGWYAGVALLLEVTPQEFIRGGLAGPANTGERWLLETLLHWRHDPTLPVPSAAELAPVLGPSHKAAGQRSGPSGPLGPRWAVGAPLVGPQLADLGFRGAEWQHHWQQDLGQVVLTKAGLPPEQRPWFNGLRQVVERCNGRLEAVFGLWYPRAQTAVGLWSRLGAKLAAHNLMLWLNHALGLAPEACWSPLP